MNRDTFYNRRDRELDAKAILCADVIAVERAESERREALYRIGMGVAKHLMDTFGTVPNLMGSLHTHSQHGPETL